jgi:hypothetical protein
VHKRGKVEVVVVELGVRYVMNNVHLDRSLRLFSVLPVILLTISERVIT